MVKEFLKQRPNELDKLKNCLAENAKIMQYLYAALFPKHYFRNNKFGIQNKSLVELAYRGLIFNIKNEPQIAKDPNNFIRPEKNIIEFEQVPMKEKEPSPTLQNSSCYHRKIIIKRKTLKQIKPKSK